MRSWILSVLLVAGLALSAQDLPQRAGAISPEEASLVAEGWTALAARDLVKASQRATTALARYPRSLGALQLNIEVDIEQNGPLAALDTYERWLGARPFDEPMAVRRIATALLREAAITSRDPVAKAVALDALAADGDEAARTSLETAVKAGSRAETELLTRKGNDQAVTRVIEDLKAQVPNKMALIDAVGESGSARAIPALMALLQDPRPEHRASAAEALGRLGARQALPQIRPLLNDTNGPPMLRMAAAGALLRLGDDSGLAVLQGWMSSPVAGMRAGAARGLAPRADASWAATVRALGDDADPTIRVEAARLLAATEPDVARGILDRLLTDKDVAVRELAGSVTVTLPPDLARLRSLLRVGTVTRVRAAERLLELTR